MSATNALVNVRPVQITDAMLIGTDVPETDYTVWAFGTFAVGDRRIMTTGIHKIYECASAHTSTGAGGAPNLNLDGTPILWLEVSPDNQWKCLDTSNSTQTAKANSAQYVLKPGQSISHVALLNNSNVTTLRVRGNSAIYGAFYDTTVYVALILTSPTWWDWFLGTRGSVSAVFLGDIPSYPDATFTIDIVGGASMAFGVLMMGQGANIGQGVQYGATRSIQDYSRPKVDVWGNTVFNKGNFAKRASFEMRLTDAEFDYITEFLESVRATPCLWIGSKLKTSTYIYGSYENFLNTLNYGDTSLCSLNLLGLT